MNKIKQLEKQIIKERKELHKLDGMDYFIKAAHICGLYKSIVIHKLCEINECDYFWIGVLNESSQDKET